MIVQYSHTFLNLNNLYALCIRYLGIFWFIRFIVKEWHIFYIVSILRGFQMVVFQIYDSIRKDLEKLLLQFSLKENYFSDLIPRVLMAVDFSVTYYSPGAVTLKTIQRFKQIYTEFLNVDCWRYELPEPGNTIWIILSPKGKWATKIICITTFKNL